MPRPGPGRLALCREWGEVDRPLEQVGPAHSLTLTNNDAVSWAPAAPVRGPWRRQPGLGVLRWVAGHVQVIDRAC
jgi:hypothetical protein